MLIVYRAKAFHLSCRFNRLACRSEEAACCFLADAVIAFLGIHFQTLLIRRLTSGVHDKCRGQVGNNLVRKKKYFRKQLTSPQKASSTKLWNEGSLLSQRWRGNCTNKLLWDKQSRVMPQMQHAGVNSKVHLRVAIWGAVFGLAVARAWVCVCLTSSQGVCHLNGALSRFSGGWMKVRYKWR